MKRTVLVLALVLMGIALLGACGSGGSKSDEPPTPINLQGKAQVEIDAKGGNQWVPPNILIDTGTEVTWKNEDTVAHNVKKGADALDFGKPFGIDAGQFGPGDTYSFTFDKAGEFPFVCTIHAGMNGRITVVAPGAATTTTTAG